jgi:Winged helix-turn helix
VAALPACSPERRGLSPTEHLTRGSVGNRGVHTPGDEVVSWAIGASHYNDLTRLGPVCVPSVYAKHACPAGDPCDLLGLLQAPHRVGYRLVMILLSQQDWPATKIAELLGCDPRTVRRWVHRYNTHGANGLADRPRVGRPRLGSQRLGARIRRLLAPFNA